MTQRAVPIEFYAGLATARRGLDVIQAMVIGCNAFFCHESVMGVLLVLLLNIVQPGSNGETSKENQNPTGQLIQLLFRRTGCCRR